MTTMEQAVSRLIAEFTDKAARMAVQAGGDAPSLSAAGAWMQAAEQLRDATDLKRDDDRTRAEVLSVTGEVNHLVSPVVGWLRRALAAAAGNSDVFADLDNLPSTVFIDSADVKVMVERLSNALAAVDPENEDREPSQPRQTPQSIEEVLTAHEWCTYGVRSERGGTEFGYACGTTAFVVASEGAADAQRRHLAVAIDAARNPTES